MWELIDMSSITGLLCLLGLIHTTGRVCASAAGDSADPSRQCPPERKKTGEKTKSETMKSLFIHLSEPLSQCTPHCSAFFVLDTQIWLVHQTMSGELGWGGLGFPSSLHETKITDGSEAHIDQTNIHIFHLNILL